MNHTDWQLLKTLYATKNITKASRLLFITQPALTKRLHHIEKELDCQVVVRSNKGVAFTLEGEFLATQAAKFTYLMDETTNHLRAMRAQNKPVIRIGAPSSFAKYFLVDLVSEFHHVYPEAEIQIRVDVSSEIPQHIYSHTIDCGFTLGETEHHLTAHLYDTQQCYAISLNPITLDDLPKMRLVIHNRNESTQLSVFNWYRNQFGQEPNVGIHVTNLDTALDMVANGLGYSIAFGSFLVKRPEFFLLPLRTQDNAPLLRNTWFIYSEGVLSNPTVKCFIDFLLNKTEATTR